MLAITDKFYKNEEFLKWHSDSGGKVYLASGIYVCARDQQERRAGEDDSFSKTTLRRLNHSSQSSLDTFLAAPQA